MKTRIISWLVAAIVSASSVIAQGYEIREVSDFYEPLCEYGYWVRHPDYGWCWQPEQVASDWRPFATGNWLWTDGGWYWESAEPWAWACYHYGRWFWDERHGWLWLPGVEWAPAWVDWRENDGYVGWAPLPPRCDFGSGGYLYTEQVVIAPSSYVFVERRHFCEPIRPTLIIFNYTTVYRQTRCTTRLHRDRHNIINEGPRAPIEIRVRPHSLREMRERQTHAEISPLRSPPREDKQLKFDEPKPVRVERGPRPDKPPKVELKREQPVTDSNQTLRHGAPPVAVITPPAPTIIEKPVRQPRLPQPVEKQQKFAEPKRVRVDKMPKVELKREQPVTADAAVSPPPAPDKPTSQRRGTRSEEKQFKSDPRFGKGGN